MVSVSAPTLKFDRTTVSVWLRGKDELPHGGASSIDVLQRVRRHPVTRRRASADEDIYIRAEVLVRYTGATTVRVVSIGVCERIVTTLACRAPGLGDHGLSHRNSIAIGAVRKVLVIFAA